MTEPSNLKKYADKENSEKVIELHLKKIEQRLE
jgi:hypothetical protein